MIEKIKQLSLCKIGIYAIYLCLQILILAALLLTTTNMIVHSIVMCITIFFYFVVSLKDPGIYIANPEPNLEDIDNKSQQKVKKHKKTSNILSQNNKKSNNQQADIKQHKQQQQKPHQTCPQQQKQLKIKKKISLEERVEAAQVPSEQLNLHPNEANKNKEQKQNDTKSQPKLQTSAKNIITAAKMAFGNFAQMISRKDLQISPEQQINSKSMKRVNFKTNSQQRQTDKISEDQQQDIAMQNNKLKKDISISKVSNRKQPPTSEIDVEQYHTQQINKQAQKNIISKGQAKVSKISQKQSCKTKLLKIKRYCRVCEYYQPLRVRHCHSCENCISTFDHHCPWINNCIGQKNKHIFLIYLSVQNLQFFIIIIDLICLLSSSQDDFNHGSVGILLLSAIIFFILLGGLLTFHLYLVGNNITTWEMYRWNRIQYLNLFDQKQLISPFSKDCKQNLKLFWSVSRDDKRKQWQDQIRDDLQQFLIKPAKIPKEQENSQNIDTNRRLFRSLHNL